MSSHAQAPAAPFFKDKNMYAEMVGTFLLVFLSIATHYFIDPSSSIGLITYIVGVILLAHCIVGISGCHINPVVSIGATLNHEISWKDCFRYIIGQLVGAILAGLIFGIIAEVAHIDFSHVTAPTVAHIDYYDHLFMAILEFVLVFVFVILVLGSVGTFERTKLGGLVVGATLVVEHMFAVVFHGASVNPAISIANLFRDFANIGHNLEYIWFYIVPPVLAALAAGFVGRKLFAHLHHAKAGHFLGHNVDDGAQPEAHHEEHKQH